MDANAVTFQLLLICALFVVFYLSLVRPQQVKLRRHRQMLDNLRPGDWISTHGGLVGTIVATERSGLITLEIAPGVHVSVTRKGVDELLGAPETQDMARDLFEERRAASLANG